MKIVKVTYTAKAGYVEQNKANIGRVMSDLQGLNNPGIRYDVFLGADGKSFIHLALFQTDEAEKVLTGLGSFKSFQEQLKANGLETPPQQELPALVGSSRPVFTGVS